MVFDYYEKLLVKKSLLSITHLILMHDSCHFNRLLNVDFGAENGVSVLFCFQLRLNTDPKEKTITYKGCLNSKETKLQNS